MEVSIKKEGSVTTIYIKGSISSANSAELENAVKDEPDEGCEELIVDARELEYISSAGLRVILTLKKKSKDKKFSVINVSSEVKNIFDVTGFSEIMEVIKAPRQISVEGCKRIGAGACGECFRLDDETIVKLYYPHVSKEEIEKEKELAKKAFVFGIPTAISYDIVECDGRPGVIYEFINAKTVCEAIKSDPDNIDKYIDMYVKVCKTVNEAIDEDGTLPLFKDINRVDIENITMISEEEKEYMRKFLDLVPDTLNCIHGDLNINNIMVQNGECCLIDMGEFSSGTPMFDLSRLLFTYEFCVQKGEEFVEFYKMPRKTLNYIGEQFFTKYFGEPLQDAIKHNDELRFLYPLAWFRSICAFIKRPGRWPKEKEDQGFDLLRNHLIPFVIEESKRQGK